MFPSINPALRNPEQNWLQLRDSLAYRQTDDKGRRRMERAVSMGLASNVDPESVVPVGFKGGVPRMSPSGTLDPSSLVYGIPRSGWGSGWGSVGMQNGPQKGTGRIQSGTPLGSAGSSGTELAERMRQDRTGGPQPMAQTPEITQRPMGDTGSPFGFTPFAERMRQEEESRQSGLSGGMASLTGFGSIPRFPFSNY